MLKWVVANLLLCLIQANVVCACSLLLCSEQIQQLKMEKERLKNENEELKAKLERAKTSTQ